MKVLITPWGNPLVWREVEYTYNLKSKKLKDPSSLIKEVEGIDKVIIVIVDTLSDEYFCSLKDPSYKDIRTISRNIVENFCKKELDFTPDKIIVSYGFGEFNRTKFDGNTMDFYYDVFKELSFYFCELIQNLNENDDLKVFFDATHGINYTTILTYNALREILEILAYAFNIELKVLNSDPLVGREAGVSKLNINVIEESKILPRISIYNSDKKPIEPYFLLSDDEKKKGKVIDDFLKQIEYDKEKILIFLGSFLFALPVFVLSHMIKSSDLKNMIDEILKKFEENIELKSGSKIKITRNLEFKENFANLVKAFLVSTILEKFEFQKLCDIPLTQIKKLKKKFFHEKLPVESNRIDVEIDKINNLQNLSQNYQLYGFILSKTNRNKIDKRNFFAHAGFEHNIIVLKEENNQKYVSIDVCNKEEAGNLIINNLPKI